MNIYDIDQIKPNVTNGTFSFVTYDLTQLTFQSRNDVELYQYEVQLGETMRIDLVCESIYGSVDYIDIIMHVNYIDNPLNIKAGTILFYPDISNVALYRIVEEQKQNVQNQLINTNKTTRKDSNRGKYIQQGYSLPPVILDKPASSVRIEGNNIVVGGL
jgi:hypothetical protein